MEKATSVSDRWKYISTLPMEESGAPSNFLKGSVFSIREIWGRRELLSQLVVREVKTRYKNSALGMLWSLLRPLTQLLIFYIAIGQFLGASRSIPQFAIFIFTGLTAWGLFSDILSGATASIVSNGGLVKKIYLPREIFPLAAVGSALFNFIIQFTILALATVVFGQNPWGWNLLLLPLAILTLVTFAFAIGLLFSAINVYLRDVQHLVEVLLLVLFWASPIAYSFTLVDSVLKNTPLEAIYLANPITLGIIGFQKAMWIAGEDQLWPEQLELKMILSIVISLLLVWLAQRVFAKLEGNFAQEL